MLPKVTMKAPPQIDGGIIKASASQTNYTIGVDRKVVVNAVDVRDLLGMGFTQVETDGSDASAKEITTSVSLTSATQGAQAIDPAARAANTRTEGDTLQAAVPNQGDNAGAAPLNGKPQPSPDNPLAKASAELEAKTKAAAGSDPSEPSAQAGTGAPVEQAATAEQQAEAAEKAKG